jgi:sulfide:quinone oxidoreductase
MSEPTGSKAFSVPIAGAGVAGLEAALTLRALAGDRVSVTLLAASSEFVYRPMRVREPFAYASARRYSLEKVARDLGAGLVRDSLAWVDAPQRVAHTDEGKALSYDAFILALGARAQPRYGHALTIDDRHLDETLHGLIQDIESGSLQSVAFVVPPRMAWPPPIYELALMTAGRAYDMNLDISVSVVTPEDSPLSIFGEQASSTVEELLRKAGVTTIASTYAAVPEPKHLELSPGDRHLKVDRIVALPELFGPSIRGLPLAEHGFVPVDLHSGERGVERVYAAGDATDFAVKHGGIAAQQADAAAEAITALAGVAIEPRRFDPEIHGILLTDDKPRYLTAHITGGRGFSSTISDTPTWSPPTKIAAKYLAPYLDELDRSTADRSVMIDDASA